MLSNEQKTCTVCLACPRRELFEFCVVRVLSAVKTWLSIDVRVFFARLICFAYDVMQQKFDDIFEVFFKQFSDISTGY